MDKELDRQELVSLVRRLQSGQVEGDAELNALITQLRERVPYPGVSDLIFWPERKYTAEEIVEIATSYRPLQL